MNPKYTFLLPAYKKEYLQSAIQSILSQSFSDFNLIISDDDSPYDLYQIVKQYESDNRVKYRKNPKNIGAKNLVDHWNLLVSECMSEYLIMASDDDIYDPDFLKEVDEFVRRYPSVNVFRPLTRHIDDNDRLIQTEKYVGEECVTIDRYVSLWGRNQLKSGVSFFVFRRTALEERGGFVNYPFAWFSDDATVFSIAKETGVCIVKTVLFSFRISTKSITGRGGNTSEKLKSGVYFAKSLESDFNLTRESEELALGRIRMLSRWALLSADSASFISGILYLLFHGQRLKSSWWLAHIINARRADNKRK